MITEMRVKGTTLPELLVTMIIGGLLLLFVFDGVDMIQAVLRQGRTVTTAPDLNSLAHFELLKERSDSVAISDSIRFYRQGEQIAVLQYGTGIQYY